MNPPDNALVGLAPPPVRPTVFHTWCPVIRAIVDGDFVQVRPHQRDAIRRASAHFDSGNQIAQVVLPTGSGKTGVAVLLPYYMVNVTKVLVIAPFPALAKQLAHDFCGPTHGIPDRGEDAFVFKAGLDLLGDPNGRQHNLEVRASIVPSGALALNAMMARQQLNNALLIINREKIQEHTDLNIAEFPLDYDLLIVDEAHHYPAATWRRIVDYYQTTPRTKILFLTATPSTLSFVPPVFTFTFEQAVLAVPPAIRDIAWCPVPGVRGQELESLVAALKQMVNQFDAPGRFYQAMIAVRRGETARAVQLYNQAMPQGHDPRERAEEFVQDSNEEVIARFKNRQFRTIVVYQRLMEGYDNPRVAFVVVARNMRNTRTFNQFVGRATRIADGHVRVAQVLSHATFGQQANFDAMRGGHWPIAQDEEEEEEE